MPFEPSFRDVYQLGIKEACGAAGAYCERLDEQVFSESMITRVYSQISKADIIVADMTGRNANVFYEVGYAHALDKRVILLTQDAKDIPFDLKHYQHIVYGGSIVDLSRELQKRLSHILANPNDRNIESVLSLELYAGGVPLASGERIPLAAYSYPSEEMSKHYPDWMVHFEFTAFNPPDVAYTDSSFALMLITTDTFTSAGHKIGSGDLIYTSIRLPSATYVHKPPSPCLLQPGEWTSIPFSLYTRQPVIRGQEHVLTARILPGGPPIDISFLGVIESETYSVVIR